MKKCPELERLIEFKEKTGWTYPTIAPLLGVSLATVQFWFTDRTKPKKDQREKIARFLIKYEIKGLNTEAS